MKINSKLPKTFIIFLKTQKNEGYLRYRSIQTDIGVIEFVVSLESKQQNASKFVNFDNVKSTAKKYIQSGKYIEVRIIDEKLKRSIKLKN